MHLIDSPKDPFQVPWDLKDIFIIFGNYTFVQLIMDLINTYAPFEYHETISETFLILFIFIYVKFRYRISVKHFGISTENLSKIIAHGLLFGFLIVLIALLVRSRLLMAFKLLSFTEAKILISSFFSVVINSGLTLIVIQPFAEELFMRGIIYAYLRKKFNIIISASISSCIFTLLHYSALHVVPITTIFFLIMGLIFAYLYERHHSIILVTIAHSVNNFLGAYLDMLAINFLKLFT